jgi:hypothetical protein
MDTTVSGAVPTNLYASAAFLDAFAKIYFPSRECRVEDFELRGRVFRLLTVDGEPLVQERDFVDMHEPLPLPAGHANRRKLRLLQGVSHALVEVAHYRDDPARGEFLGAPTTIWSGFGSWDDYLDLLRTRKVLADDRRRNRRLQEALGSLEYTSSDPGSDVLPTCFAWKSTRDRELGRTDLFAQAQHRAFFHELLARGLLRVSTLRAGGRLLAAWLGAVHERRWTGWVFAFNPDPALSKYSLGRQLLYPMLEESYRSGQAEFDFSIGVEPYKLYFATHVRAVAPLGSLPLSQRLRVVARKLLKRRA